jgi:hypothetical protein
MINIYNILMGFLQALVTAIAGPRAFGGMMKKGRTA